MRKSTWVLVDSGWAKELGVTRTAGVYRISRRELARKLGAEPQGGRGICASIHEQSLKAGSRSNWRVEEQLVA
jgi:hypothetical protein